MHRWSFPTALVVSTLLLLWPSVDGPEPMPHSDKLVHGLIFFVLGWTGRRADLPYLPLVGVLAAYAALTEVVQGVWLPGRSGGVPDLAADLVGILLGAGTAALVGRRRSVS